MAPLIEIDDDVLNELKQRAEPFVDTENSVLRRVFGLDRDDDRDDLGHVPSGNGGPEVPVPMGASRMPLPMTPQREFRPAIVAALMETGGRRSMAEVLSEVERRMAPRLLEGDRAAVSTGEIRWRNAARWERMQMAKEGLIKKGTRSGWWELTDAGKRA